MIGSREFFREDMMSNSTAQQLKRYSETAAQRRAMGLPEGGRDSFAAKLKQADENLASGEFFGTTDSINLILRQMEEPQKWAVTKTVFHNGVEVSVTKDPVKGTNISIGGSKNPDPIHVKTSVGTVDIDLNDTNSVMKCLDMFSPEDVTAILREITKANQLRRAEQELEDMANGLADKTPNTDKEDK